MCMYVVWNSLVLGRKKISSYPLEAFEIMVLNKRAMSQ